MRTNIVEYIKSLFRLPSAEVLALRELEESKRSLLNAQSIREHAEAMCKCHEARIKRLTAYLHTVTEVQS